MHTELDYSLGAGSGAKVGNKKEIVLLLYIEHSYMYNVQYTVCIAFVDTKFTCTVYMYMYMVTMTVEISSLYLYMYI